MKKEHCVLILICCFLMAACGRLEDIPEDLSAFPETERKETAETPAGPQFETLTVADDPITAEFSLTTRQEPAAFLYVAVEEDCTTTVNCTYASQDQPVTVCLAGGESWELQGASEEAYGAIWSNWPVTLRQGENVFCITGGGSFCRMRLELLDAISEGENALAAVSAAKRRERAAARGRMGGSDGTELLAHPEEVGEEGF